MVCCEFHVKKLIPSSNIFFVSTKYIALDRLTELHKKREILKIFYEKGKIRNKNRVLIDRFIMCALRK